MLGSLTPIFDMAGTKIQFLQEEVLGGQNSAFRGK